MLFLQLSLFPGVTVPLQSSPEWVSTCPSVLVQPRYEFVQHLHPSPFEPVQVQLKLSDLFLPKSSAIKLDFPFASGRFQFLSQ